MTQLLISARTQCCATGVGSCPAEASTIRRAAIEQASDLILATPYFDEDQVFATQEAKVTYLDREYYRRRAKEEIERACLAANICARDAHLQLARLYTVRLREPVHESLIGALDTPTPLSPPRPSHHIFSATDSVGH